MACGYISSSYQETNICIGQIIVGYKSTYRIKEVIGNGAISQVLLAEVLLPPVSSLQQQQQSWQSTTSSSSYSLVAMKVLKATTFLGKEVNKYFDDELQLMRGLCNLNSVSQHIVQPIEVVEFSFDCYLLVMEYCPHGSLLDQIRSAIPERLRVVVNFSAQLAQGLAFLHDIGIAHRDLKPENIFIGEQYGSFILKIGDFGLAKIIADQRSMMSSCIGTINYMAPEMLRSENYDASVDVWSLGCIMHELLTGEQLFAEHSAEGIASQIKAFSRYNSHKIPGVLGVIISSCLRPSPTERICVKDLCYQLFELYRQLSIQHQQPSEQTFIQFQTQQQQQQPSNSPTTVTIRPPLARRLFHDEFTNDQMPQHNDTHTNDSSLNKSSMINQKSKRIAKSPRKKAAATIMKPAARPSKQQQNTTLRVSLLTDEETQRVLQTTVEHNSSKCSSEQRLGVGQSFLQYPSTSLDSLQLRRASSEIFDTYEEEELDSQETGKYPLLHTVASPITAFDSPVFYDSDNHRYNSYSSSSHRAIEKNEILLSSPFTLDNNQTLSFFDSFCNNPSAGFLFKPSDSFPSILQGCEGDEETQREEQITLTPNHSSGQRKFAWSPRNQMSGGPILNISTFCNATNYFSSLHHID